VNIAAETIVRLSHIPNIVGVKEASGNLEQVAHVVENTREDFLVWSGNDGDTLPMLSVGGYGVICVVSHLVGNQMKGMIEDYLAGRVEEAARTHRSLLPLISTLMTAASNPIPVKYALNLVGFQVGGLRLPLCEPDQAAGERIAAEVKRHRIDLPVTV
jgi:4-hydroxy-tetrahydrodipicolinate synthase